MCEHLTEKTAREATFLQDASTQYWCWLLTPAKLRFLILPTQSQEWLRLHNLLPESSPSELNLLQHRTKGGLIQSNMTEIWYYIRSKLIWLQRSLNLITKDSLFLCNLIFRWNKWMICFRTKWSVIKLHHENLILYVKW